MTDVFISYRREDREHVQAIAERLERIGLSVWFDTRLATGSSFDETIAQELRAAKLVLVCWTPGAIESQWVRAEAAMAHAAGKLVAAFLAPTELIPPFNLIHAEDLSDWGGEDDHDGWVRLLTQIALRSGKPELEAWGRLVDGGDAAGLRAWIAQAPSGVLRSAARFRLSEGGGRVAKVVAKSTAQKRRGAGALIAPLVALAVLAAGGFAAWRSLQPGGARIIEARSADAASAPLPPASGPDTTNTAPGVRGLTIPVGAAVDLEGGMVSDAIVAETDFVLGQSNGGGAYFLMGPRLVSIGTLPLDQPPTPALCQSQTYFPFAIGYAPRIYQCFKTTGGGVGYIYTKPTPDGFEGLMIEYRFF